MVTVEELHYDKEDDEFPTDWECLFELAGDQMEPNYNHAAISPCFGSEEVITNPVLRSDVVEVIASYEDCHEDGCWDGLIVVKTKDGRFVFIDGGCGNTGWGSYSGGCCVVDNDLAHLIRFGIGVEERAKLGLE